MARSRSHGSILEQSRRHWRGLALAAAFVVVAGLVGLAVRAEPKPSAPSEPPTPLAPGRVMVEVLNGTGRQGAARTATRILRRRGLDVVFLGNADSLTETTRIVVRRGGPGRARYVAAVLGAGKLIVETDTFRRVDVSVILGDDFKPKLEIHP
jgi:hypothetical protein